MKGNLALLERYRRLIDLTLELSSSINLDDLLERVTNAALELSDSQAAAIFLYEEATRQLYFEAFSGLNEKAVRGFSLPIESSIAGYVVQKRQPVMVSGTKQAPQLEKSIQKYIETEIASLLCVPLMVRNQVHGVLEVVNKREQEYNEEDLRLLCVLGTITAAAIDSSRLYQQTDMISEMIHEFRTPLSSMTIAAHFLSKQEVPEDQRKKMVEIIQDETFRLSELATSYLDLTKLESGRAQFHSEILEVKEVLLDCERAMRGRAEQKGLQFTLDIPEDLPLIDADRLKLKQAILNLLSNAIKFNRTGGCVILGARREGDDILISVKDSGPGIQGEYIPHLFEKHYRTPGSENMAPGAGLGLSICQKIVKAHRGWIEVQSEVGSGSTFIIHLPVSSSRL